MIEFLKKYKLILVTIPIIIILLTFNFLNNENTEIEEEPIIEKETKKEPEKKKIKVDIKGQINAKGVYELEYGQRVSDLIEKAGGLTRNADTSLLNLSKILKDEMVVIIYSKEEVQKLKNSQKEKEECICPKENDACLTNEADETLISSKKDTTKEKSQTKISINTATLEQLQTLTGIGESKAKAIISYREKNGNFKTIEEIKEVSGIGDSIFEKIKNNITI